MERFIQSRLVNFIRGFDFLFFLNCEWVALQTRVDPAKDVIYVNGNRLPKRQPRKVYLALNKPKGYFNC